VLLDFDTANIILLSFLPFGDIGWWKSGLLAPWNWKSCHYVLTCNFTRYWL